MTKFPLFVVLVATLCAFASGPLATSAGAAAVPDDATRADEPLRGEFSLDAAVAYLDQMALSWQRDRKCFACHSDYAYLESRPLVSSKTPVHDELRVPKRGPKRGGPKRG
jgi:hypothetical protein